MNKNLKDYALWTALITPLTKEGTLHQENLKTLLHRQEEAGNGVVLLGSTGEALLLKEEEKKQVLEIALSLNLNIPLMVGVGGTSLHEAQSWVEYCETLPLDAYLMVSPLYTKPGLEGQVHWFQTLLDQASKPCMLYNVPSRTGSPLKQETLARLKDHQSLWAVKEASGSISEFQKYREAAPHIPLYSGDDALMPAFSTAGAKGLVSVLSNVWPKETHQYVNQCLSGKFGDLFPLWARASEALFLAANPIPAKALLHHLGVIETENVCPPLHTKDLNSTQREKLYAQDSLIKSWAKKVQDK